MNNTYFSFECHTMGKTLDLLDKSLRNPNIYVRHKALDILIQKYREQALPLLIKALKDKNWYVRSEAVWAMGQLKDRGAREALIEALGDPERKVYSRAAQILTSFGWSPFSFEEKLRFYFALGNFQELLKLGDDAFELMLKALNDRASWDLACKASKALGLIGDMRAADSLINILNSQNLMVLRRAAEALGRIGHKKALKPLLKLLEKDEPELELKVIEALGRLGDSSAVEAICAGLKSNNPEIRLITAKALLNFSDERAVKPLIDIIKKDKNLEIKRIAIMALGMTKSPYALKFLLDLYDRGLPELYRAILEALIEMRSKKAIPAFLQSLASKEPDIKFLAVRGLGKTGHKKSIPPLLDMLGDKDWRVKSETIRALGRLEALEALEELKVFLHHKRSYIRKVTVGALGNMGSPSAPLLKEALYDSHNYVRFKASEFLDKMEWEPLAVEEKVHYYFAKREYHKLLSEGEAGVSVLLKGLGDSYSIIKEGVENFIVSLGDEGTPLLLQATKREEPQVRAAGLKLLGELSICGDTIAGYLEDENSSVRRTAAGALRRFPPSPVIIEALKNALEDSDVGVRNTANKSLRKLNRYKRDGHNFPVKERKALIYVEDPFDREYSYEEMSVNMRESNETDQAEGGSVMELCNKMNEKYYPEKYMNIVLFEPRIPPNTGNIARLCAGTGSKLFLVGNLGFSLRDRTLKRAGLDYWHLVRMFYYPTMEELYKDYAGSRFFYFSSNVSRPYTCVNYKSGDFLVFGSERPGLPVPVLEDNSENSISIPMWGEARSFNLATSVGIALYEALRQINNSWE